MSGLLNVEGLCCNLPSGEVILGDVSLGVDPGQLIWISGPSGGGKSTLLRILNRLQSTGGGRLTFEGRDYAEWSIPRLRRRMVLMPQTPILVQGTVEENLLLPFKFKAADKSDIPRRDSLREILDYLGLEGMELERKVTGLSVGQRQRLSLGRISLMKPRMMLMDEPLAALDEKSRQSVEAWTAEFAAAGGAVIMVSHIRPEGGSYLHLILDKGTLTRAEMGEAG